MVPQVISHSTLCLEDVAALFPESVLHSYWDSVQEKVFDPCNMHFASCKQTDTSSRRHLTCQQGHSTIDVDSVASAKVPHNHQGQLISQKITGISCPAALATHQLASVLPHTMQHKEKARTKTSNLSVVAQDQSTLFLTGSCKVTTPNCRQVCQAPNNVYSSWQPYNLSARYCLLPLNLFISIGSLYWSLCLSVHDDLCYHSHILGFILNVISYHLQNAVNAIAGFLYCFVLCRSSRSVQSAPCSRR
jgi:hypothetical protein